MRSRSICDFLQNEHFVTLTRTNMHELSQYLKIEMENKSIFSVAMSLDKKKRSQHSPMYGRLLKYYESLGYVNPDGPVELQLNIGADGTENNAFYSPKFADEQPRLTIGRGDGTELANLSLDSDVVSHEFGHHTLWRTLKLPIGETLVLHGGTCRLFSLFISRRFVSW